MKSTQTSIIAYTQENSIQKNYAASTEHTKKRESSLAENSPIFDKFNAQIWAVTILQRQPNIDFDTEFSDKQM